MPGMPNISVELKTISGEELMSWGCPRSMSVPKALGQACGEAEEMIVNSPGMTEIRVAVYDGDSVREARVRQDENGRITWDLA